MNTKTLRLNGRNLAISYDEILGGRAALCLDCFDTLFWRATQKPIDVFVSLAQRPLLLAHNIDMIARINAESLARRRKHFMVPASNEVTLEEIYHEAGAPPETISALIEEELREEQRYGFIFEPIYELAVEAKRRGLKVLVISDTYFSPPQLFDLLTKTKPELANIIDGIHTSSADGRSKADGLWPIVLATNKLRPEQITHVGDNRAADYTAPLRLGIAAHHLDVGQNKISGISNQREVSSIIACGLTRIKKPVLDPYKGLLAELEIDSPEKAVGYGVLGPIMLAFAQKVLATRDDIESQGRRCHLGFLLRDGYLISEVVSRLDRKPDGKSLLNLSRATALSSSIVSHDDIDNLLIKYFNPKTFETSFPQIKLAEDIQCRVKEILQHEVSSRTSRMTALLHEKEVASRIFEDSHQFRQRLLAHITSRIAAKKDDTILFVDLGYYGTVQNYLHDILKRELDIEIQGCYLISAYTRKDKGSRQGLIDPGNSDGALIGALTGPRIAALEMLCTNDTASTVDFKANGDPIFSSVDYSKQQTKTTRNIQAHCLEFIDLWLSKKAGFVPQLDEDMQANYVATELSRFAYFPTEEEVAVLRAHEFDKNFGSDSKKRLFDLDAAAKEVATHGIAFANHANNVRMASQFELRSIDACYSMATFMLNRHGSNFDFAKNSYRGISIDGFLLRDSVETKISLMTQPTYDGYHLLSIPFIPSTGIGVMLGKAMRLLQIDSVQLISHLETASKTMVNLDEIIMDGTSQIHNNIYQLIPNGFWLFMPKLIKASESIGIKIVFRPLELASPPEVALNT